MKDIHITLHEEVLARLDDVARRVDSNRTFLVREAVEEYVARRERDLLAADMARYAAEMAPLSGEFVAETGPEVERMLRESTEW